MAYNRPNPQLMKAFRTDRCEKREPERDWAQIAPSIPIAASNIPTSMSMFVQSSTVAVEGVMQVDESTVKLSKIGWCCFGACCCCCAALIILIVVKVPLT